MKYTGKMTKNMDQAMTAIWPRGLSHNTRVLLSNVDVIHIVDTRRHFRLRTPQRVLHSNLPYLFLHLFPFLVYIFFYLRIRWLLDFGRCKSQRYVVNFIWMTSYRSLVLHERLCQGRRVRMGVWRATVQFIYILRLRWEIFRRWFQTTN